MHIGAAMFFTDYSMSPGELGKALEERGFESVWAPEHSHSPLTRKSPFPGGGELPKKYYDAMDPFVALMAAAGGVWLSTSPRSFDAGNDAAGVHIDDILLTPVAPRLLQTLYARRTKKVIAD